MSWLPLRLAAAKRGPLHFQCCSWCMKPSQSDKAKEGLAHQTQREILSHHLSELHQMALNMRGACFTLQRCMQGVKWTSTVSAQHT